MIILGIDPGIRDAGYAVIDSRDARIRSTGYVGTTKGDDTGDTQRRLDEQLDLVAPIVRTVDLVVVEFPTGGFGGKGQKCPACKQPRGNARAATLTAASASAFMGLAKGCGKQCIAPAPVTWRNAIGYPPGQDDALYAQLAIKYPRTAARLRKGHAPHIWDGLGQALYGRLVASNLTSARNDS